MGENKESKEENAFYPSTQMCLALKAELTECPNTSNTISHFWVFWNKL